MSEKIKAYIDLLRLHFFFVWPVLFSAGLFLGFIFNGSFSWTLVLQAVMVGFFGFEAGLVLNDIVDANLDKKELPTDKRLTKYWRPFGGRPMVQGLISPRKAALFFFFLITITITIIVTLPYPHSIYVFGLMVICYCLEIFYQIKKRNEQLPVAQIFGRIDFALFLVAGYLVVGNPDFYALLLFLFFYPLALAHLGVNDLVDVANDNAKGMNTPPTLYGMNATAYWVLFFSVFHLATASVLLYLLGSYLAIGGFAVSFSLLTVANKIILSGKNSQVALKALPLFHLSMLIYAITIIVNYALPFFNIV
jgi:4-hydroxybenzoate polyprenyltransferase